METADVIVIGLGAMGSATCHQLARRGTSVIGIDRWSPPHDLGSTHGDTRITRQATVEGRAYIPLVRRSQEIWRELEAEADVDLFNQCGMLKLREETVQVGNHGTPNSIELASAMATEFDIEHEVLTNEQLTDRFPQFRLDGEYRGYFEPGSGFVRPEAAVDTQLRLAERNGARLRRNEKVLEVEASTTGVVVRTEHASYSADKVVVSAGPWVGKLLPDSGMSELTLVCKQALHWFDIAGDRTDVGPDQMPVYIWEFNEHDGFYGFPAVDGPRGGLKVATEQFEVAYDPDNLDRNVPDIDSQVMFEQFLSGRLPVTSTLVKRAGCLYTVAARYRFLIDRHPQHDNVIIASPCSGHGFKHSAAIGEALAQWCVDGQPAIDLSSFAFPADA